MGVPTVAQAKTFVALDVHVSGTVAAMIDRDSGSCVGSGCRGVRRRWRSSWRGWRVRCVRPMRRGRPGSRSRARLEAAGVDCLVCAPGLIPRGPSDRVKTDQRDAERLVRLLVAGELAAVAVPSIEAEALRDLVRAREDLRGDLMSARHRVWPSCCCATTCASRAAAQLDSSSPAVAGRRALRAAGTAGGALMTIAARSTR